MLVVCGTATWKYADAATDAWLERAPDKDEFLLSEDVRDRELKVEGATAELTVTRAKMIEQGFVSDAAAAPYRARIAPLERTLTAAEKDAFEGRRAAVDRYQAAALRFNARHRAVTLLFAIGLAMVAFLLLRVLGALAAGGVRLNAHWGLAAGVACCVLAPIYGFEAAGPLGAVVGAMMVLLLLVRA
jgi:hypothetical protein